MKRLLPWCGLIDRISERVGRLMIWLVLASVLISAGNAIVRKAFSMSSNALLEVQWYLFAAVFLLGAAYVLLRDEHVRIDALSNRWSRRTQVWIDVFGIVLCVLPLCVWIVWMSWPVVANAYETGEISSNAGGLIRWPVYALMPLSFVLLAFQACSELVKRIAFLTGDGPDPAVVRKEASDEEKLIEDLRRQSQAANRATTEGDVR